MRAIFTYLRRKSGEDRKTDDRYFAQVAGQQIGPEPTNIAEDDAALAVLPHTRYQSKAAVSIATELSSNASLDLLP